MRHVRWRWRNSCSSVLADATQTSRGDHNAIRCDHRVTKIYDIGPFRLDAEALVLTEAGVPVALGSRGVAVVRLFRRNEVLPFSQEGQRARSDGSSVSREGSPPDRHTDRVEDLIRERAIFDGPREDHPAH
jgi:hypothetical protein